jgi:hypothetical protein
MNAGVSKLSRAAIILTLLLPALGRAVSAQTTDEGGGLAVRELSLTSGYTSVQLPPITLGGELPNGILDADLITSGTAAIDWWRVTARTRYTLELFGTYTARARYPRLNTPSGNLTFAVSRALSNRWRLGVGVAAVVVSSDQITDQPAPGRRLVDNAASFADLAGTVALARSPSPDLSHAALFLPIAESLAASDVFGSRQVVSTARAQATYRHSPRLATDLRSSYTIAKPISSNQVPGQLRLSADATVESAGVGIRYDRTQRTQVIADLTWSRASGDSTDEAISASLGYGWFGRKWFTRTTMGVALRPFPVAVAAAPVTAPASRMPSMIYSGAVGYKFQSQTLLVEYSRAPHDEFGHGGRNTKTGFQGNVQSVFGSWLWSSPLEKWTMRSDFTMVRRPGNFSYIYAWLSTLAIGRQVTPQVQLIGEALFDRHGSRMFEGFHMTRRGARLYVTWTPSRRAVAAAASDQ